MSQTFDRGLQALKLVAAAPDGATVNEVGAALGLNRTVVYRLLSTLVHHGLIARDADGRYVPAGGIVGLAEAVAPQLREVAMPHLRVLADEIGATAHLTIAEGELGVALAVVEPRSTTFHVAYRVGSRHPLEVGAAGVAILSGRPPQRGDSAAVKKARRSGYATTSGELEPGAVGLAAPILTNTRREEASVGVVALSDRPLRSAAPTVVTAATEIARARDAT
jgi:DNA-binding IclR family transcriptional regulator